MAKRNAQSEPLYFVMLLLVCLLKPASPALAHDSETEHISVPDSRNDLSSEVSSDISSTLGNKQIIIAGGLLLASFDSNTDAQLDRREIRDGIARAFQRADQNGDGVISIIEQRDWTSSYSLANSPLHNPAYFDHNHDRTITPEEFSTAINMIVDSLNGNRDKIDIPLLRLTRSAD